MKKSNSFLNILILFIILVCGIFTFSTLKGNVPLQMLVGVTTTVAYVIWGILHHLMENSLHKQVVVEYILIGVIAILMLFIVLRP
jgi:hypothetical protein